VTNILVKIYIYVLHYTPPPPPLMNLGLFSGYDPDIKIVLEMHHSG
jgi:hypothetical protein